MDNNLLINNIKIIDEREVLGKDFKIYGDIENPLFLAKDVANWIEHSRASEMLKGVDEDEKLLQTILASGQNREMWFLTEDGMYEVLMQSRKPIARAFKKQVKVILKSIRKNGLYQTKLLTATEQLELQLKAMKEQDKKIDKVDKKVENLKADMPLFNLECKEIQAKVRKVGIKMLGGYGTPAYRDNSTRGKVYSDIQSQLKREFGVQRYEAIKRCQMDRANEIIQNYKLPLILKDEIAKLNNQVEMEV